mgnify:FL=1
MNQTQRIFLRIFKIAAAASAGSFLAMMLRLATPTSAGIIAILSLQNTRRETFSLVVKRILSFFPAMAVALTVFSLMGYRIFSIFIYLVLFAAICELFSLQNTLVSNTVLVLHLFTAQSAHPSLLLNELLLLLIGTACGILMNLYMPGNSARIRQAQARSEQIFRETFHRIAQDLVMDKQLACTFFDPSPLDLILEKLEKEAWENRGNTLLSDEQYFVKYVEMRKHQKAVVEKLCQNIRLLHGVPSQAHTISRFIRDISVKFHESNNTKELMQQLSCIQTSMQKEPLPSTRAEFENRAVLYRILYDLEELITIKKRFIETLTPEEISRFWNTDTPGNC